MHLDRLAEHLVQVVEDGLGPARDDGRPRVEVAGPRRGGEDVGPSRRGRGRRVGRGAGGLCFFVFVVVVVTECFWLEFRGVFSYVEYSMRIKSRRVKGEGVGREKEEGERGEREREGKCESKSSKEKKNSF